MSGPRFVIFGAGAIGGGIGGRLHQHGHEVVLIARGAHFEAIKRAGLRLESPDGSDTVKVPTVARPADVDWRSTDVVILGVKGQDTVAALESLRATLPQTVPIVCAQNGVANERVALRLFPDVYGMCVMMPSVHLEPGVVRLYASPIAGNLDVGRYPSGVDSIAEAIASALSTSTFSSRAVPDVMRWKHTKLLMNLGNSMQALCGASARGGDLYRRARAEAEAAFGAAGIVWASPEEDADRRKDLKVPPPADSDGGRPGGSSWQSLARGTGTIEADFLNGEVVLLGRMHGVPTPVNERLQTLAVRAARERWEPGRLTPEDVLADL